MDNPGQFYSIFAYRHIKPLCIQPRMPSQSTLYFLFNVSFLGNQFYHYQIVNPFYTEQTANSVMSLDFLIIGIDFATEGNPPVLHVDFDFLIRYISIPFEGISHSLG